MKLSKHNFICVIDKIVWWFIALFPLILLMVSAIHHNITSMTDILNTIGFNVTNNNIIYNGLNDIFGATGNYLQLFANTDIIAFATYFVTVNLLHLVIDILMWLVDYCHELLKGVFHK